MPNREGHRRFGNIRKRESGRFQIRYPGPDGRMRTGPGTYERKSDAARALTLIEAAMVAGEWTDPQRGKVQLGDYAATWIAERPGLRVRTVDLYSWHLARHIAPYLGAVPVGKLSTPMIRKWRADLLSNGVSESMAAKAYRLLRAVLTTAVDEDKILRRQMTGRTGTRIFQWPAWVLAASTDRVDHCNVLPDPGCYQERYRLTGSAALGSAASLLAIALGILWHTPAGVVVAVALGFLAALDLQGGDVLRVARRVIAFRADLAGVTLGAVPGRLTPRGGSAVFVPWADVEQIVLYPAYPRGRGRYSQARCIGIRRREGAPALSWGNEQAPGCPVPGVAAAVTRRITAWQLDRERLADVTAAVAPGIPIVDSAGRRLGHTETGPYATESPSP